MAPLIPVVVTAAAVTAIIMMMVIAATWAVPDTAAKANGEERKQSREFEMLFHAPEMVARRGARMTAELIRAQAVSVEIGIDEAGLAVAQGLAVCDEDGAAGGLQHGLGRRGVPLEGAAEARIKIRRALGQAQEFQRRADIGERGNFVLREQGGEGGVGRVMARGHDGEAQRGG